MSRTKKGAKPVGWDYWGKRPIGLGAKGTKNKRVGLKVERAKLKDDARKQPRETEYYPEEYVPPEVPDEKT